MFGNVHDAYKQSVAIAWDSSSSYAKAVDRILSLHLSRLDSRASILDIGGASRWWIRRFGRETQAIVLDLSSTFLHSVAAENRWKMLLGANCEALPLDSASFDLVLIQGVLHHVPDQRLALAEAGRILRPGGTLIVIEPAKWSVALVYYLIKRLVYIFFGTWGLRRILRYYGSPHESFVSPAIIRCILGPPRFSVYLTKTTPFRFPYIGKATSTRVYRALENALNRTVFARWFGSYLFAEISRSFVAQTVSKRD